MSKLLDVIKKIFGLKPSRKGPPAYVYVYLTGKSNAEVNPNDQIAILRRLSSFVSKRHSPVTVIFPGRPTRKIPDGTKQDGVQVRFATSDQLERVIKQSLAEFQKDHCPVLAADRSEFQKLADKLDVGYSLASTFVKTLETVCGPLQRETKPQQPRRQQQAPAKETQQAPDAPDAEKATGIVPDDSGTEPLESSVPESSETPSDSPAPLAEPSSRIKLRRHNPSQKREPTDRAILDLIDPL